MSNPASPMIGPATDQDAAGIVALWERCDLTRPWNDAHADLSRARGKSNSDVLVLREDGAIVATVMVGHEGHRGWVYYVAVEPEQQGRGHGRAIMTAAEVWLRERGIPKLMLLVRGDNKKVQSFYETIGFAAQDRVVYAKWLDGREATP